MKIKAIMSKNIISAKTTSNIYEIAKLMKENDIGFLPIIDDKLIGVITDRDIVIRCIYNNDYTSNIKSYINNFVVKIDENKEIIDGINLMCKYKVKRLIVTKNNKVSGILSLSDIINTNAYNDIIINCIKNIYEIKNNLQQTNNKIDDFYL